MTENNEFLKMQLESLGERTSRVEGLLEKLFDGYNEMRVILERNTVTVEQHHRRSLALERITVAAQKRLENAEHELLAVKTTTEQELKIFKAALAPVTTHVERVNRWMFVFTGLPGVIKFFTLLFGFIVGAYGVYSIAHDLFMMGLGK